MADVFDEWAARQKRGAPASGVAAPQGYTDAAVDVFDEWAASNGGQAPQLDLSGSYRAWYTGQNLQSPANGWNSEFMQASQQQYDQALQQGTVLQRFAQPDAVGVVTWDGATDSKGNRLVFGDIVSGGEKVGNVYQDVDDHTANVLMGEWTIQDGALKARLNNASDPDKAWSEEINRIRTESTKQAELAPRAAAFEEGVEQRAEEENVGALVAAGAGGGAATGAMGFLAGPLVGAITTGVGALIGGVGAFLNQDSLAYQIAREREKLDVIAEQGNGAGYTAQLARSVAQSAGSVALNPFANLVQGTYDVATDEGPVFDAGSGGRFYATDAEGQRLAPGAVQVAELVSRVGDSVLTFASPVARAAYTAQMATGIAGKAAGLAPGVGQWDDSDLVLDSVWTDDEGNFDAGAAAAGVASVGIDAVQLGGVRGLFSVGRRSTRREGGTWAERLNLSGEQRRVLKEGGQLETVAGWKFVFDDAGKVVGEGRATLGMLAPSEALQSLSAKAIARREAAKANGAVESERLYQAAYELSVGEKAVQTALVNAFGEAQEEGLQQLLDPISHGNAVVPEEVYRAAAAGFASGLGMGVAANVTAASADDRMFGMADLAHRMRTGGQELSRDDWQQMSQVQKRTLVRSAQMERTVAKGAWEAMERDRTAALEGDVVAAERVRDWYKKWSTTQLERGTRATDASHTIVQLDDARFRPDSIATSHTQLLADQRNRTLGIETQLEAIDGRRDPRTGEVREGGELQQIAARLVENPADETLLARQAELTAAADQLRRMRDYSRRIEGLVDTVNTSIAVAVEQGDTVEVARLADGLNQRLQEIYDLEPDPRWQVPDEDRLVLAKAVSRIATRHPEDSSASFQSFLPQVDPFFAEVVADGIAAVSQLTNKAMRSDFDGDKVHSLQQLVLSDKEYLDLRSGMNILGAGVTPEIGESKPMAWVVDELRVALHSGSSPIRSLATQVGDSIEADLRDWYGGFVPDQALDAVMDAVRGTIAIGGDVRQTVLTEMSRRAGQELAAIGRGERPHRGVLRISNQPMLLAQMVTEHLQAFQSQYAMRRPRRSQKIGTDAAPARISTDIKVRRGIQAATQAAWMVEVVPGDNLFRMFQKLHYQLMGSTELYVGWSSEAGETGFRDLAELYEQLSREATGLRAEDVTISEAVVDRVQASLRALAKDPGTLSRLGLTAANNMALLANVETAQWVYDVNPATDRRERRYTGRRVTLGQQLLYQALEEHRAANIEVWSNDEVMQSTYRRLIELTRPPVQNTRPSHIGAAERAFVEIFDTVPLYDLVGQDAAAMGLTQTVGQYFRQVLDKSPDERRADHALLELEGAYRARTEDGQANPHTVPYRLQEVSESRVTVFRTLVDSVFSAASSEISKTATGDTKGKVTGRMAERSATIGTEIQETYTQVRALMSRLMPQQSYTAEDVRTFVERNPDIGQLILAAIPDNLMPVVYKGATAQGKPRLATWYYDLFAQPTAEAMEMRLRWNTWMTGWQALEAGLEIDEEVPTNEQSVRADQIKSRFHRLMYSLAVLAKNAPGESHYLQELMVKGQTADSVEKFMDWLNNESGLVTLGAPMLAWVDDTAEFDATKSGSGWSQGKSMTQLREDLRVLRDAAVRKLGMVDTRQQQIDEDMSYVASIRRGLQAANGTLPTGATASPDDIFRWRQFEAVVENARRNGIAYGPRAMVLQTAITAYGIYGQAHTKGSNPEHLAAVEAAEAMLNSFGYTVNLEQLIGDVTTHNEDAVAASPELIVKDAGRMMDADGAQVTWPTQTAEMMLDLLEKSPDNIELVVSMLSTQVMELGYDNRPRRQVLHGQTIKGLLDSTSHKRLYNDDGRPGLTQAMKYLAELEAELRDTSPFAVQQRVAELVVARTSALDHSASLTEMQQMTVQAYLDVAAALQEVGRTQVAPGAADPVHEVWADLRKGLRTKASLEVLGLRPSAEQSLDEKGVVAFVGASLTAKYEQQISALRDAADATADPDYAQVLQDRADALQARWDADLQRLDELVNGDVLSITLDTYRYDASMPDVEKVQRRDVLMDYVARHGDVLQGSGDAMPLMQKIGRYWYEKASTQAATQPDLTDEQWTLLSRTIISLHLSNLVTLGTPVNSPPAYPDAPKEGRLDKRRFWDFTWSYLGDFLSPDATDGLLDAARRHARTAGKVATERDSAEITETMLNTIFRRDSLGTWTPAIPIQSIEQYDLLTGASSAPAISMAGLLTQRHSAVAAATRRTFEVPPATMDSHTSLIWSDLDWEDDTQREASLYSRLVEITHPDGRVVERPLIQVAKRFARKMTLTYDDPTSGRTTIDAMDPPFAEVWGPAFDDTSLPRDLRVINLNRIRDGFEMLARELAGGDRAVMRQILGSAELEIDFLHPEAQPSAPEYANNLWFEGTVFDSSGDVSDSLLFSLWFGAGGINAQVQQAALDTRKKGLAGIERYPRPRQREVALLESLATDDFAAMLASKTEIVMTTDLGTGRLGPEFYNAIYKLMKLKHWVDGTTADGARVRLSAEQVMERQAKFGKGYWDANGVALSETSLWVPSDQVLASMLGEIGYGGTVGRFRIDRAGTDLDAIPTFRGWTDAMSAMFSPEPAQPKTLTDTMVARTIRLSGATSDLELDPKQRDLFRRREEAFRYQRARIRDERQMEVQRGFDPKANLRRAEAQAVEWMGARDITLELESLPWAQLPAAETLASSRTALSTYIADQQAQTGNTVSGFILEAGGPSNPYDGLLSLEDLGGGRIPLGPGDVVVVNFASFSRQYPADEARKKAHETVRALASQNVAILPLAANGPSSLATEMSHALRNQYFYERYQDSPNILVPNVMYGRRYMNAAAAASSLSTSSGVTIRKQRLIGLLKNKPVEENTMLVSTRRRSRFETTQLIADLLPINVAARFGVPQTREHLDMVVNHLEGLNTAAGRKHLRDRVLKDTKGDKKAAAKEFDEAWDRLMSRIYQSRAQNTTLPLQGMEFGTGDIIPLLSPRGELLLYRHGYQFPYADFHEQLSANEAGKSGARMVAVYSGKRVAGASVHRGRVSRITSRQRYGLQLELEIDSKALGSKQVFEVNGMKWLLAPLGEQFQEPDVPLLGQGPTAVYLDGFGALSDSVSKQATDGWVVNFRNGFTVFGADFLPDLARFFQTTPDRTRKILRAIERHPGKKSVREIKELQDLLAGASPFVQTLQELLPGLQAAGLDETWLDRLEETTPEAYIARSMLLYLMSEGADLDTVLYSSGLWVDTTTEPEAQSQRMDRLFTRMFDLAPMGSPVRTELFRRFNRRLNETNGEGWYIDEAWNLYGTNASGEEVEMILDFGEAHVSDDNPELNVQAQERRVSQGTSMHAGLVTQFGVGGDLFPSPRVLRAIDAALAPGRTRLDDGEIWRTLTNVSPATYGPGSQWQRSHPAEQHYHGLSIRRFVAYRKPIEWKEETVVGWQDEEDGGAAIRAKKNDVRLRLGLQPAQEVVVDYLIRQMLWRPGAFPGQIGYDEKFTASEVLEVLDLMLDNLKDGYFPTHRAPGPHMLSWPDLHTLFLAAQRGGTWRPYGIDKDPDSALGTDDIGDWIRVAFGQALNSDVEIDELMRLDLDGFMNTYRGPLKEMGHFLDITLDKELQGKFLDESTNELIAYSTSPLERERLMEEIILPRLNLQFDGIRKGVTTAESLTGWDAEVSIRSHSRRRVAAFRRKNKIRPRERTSARDYVQYGAKVLESGSDAHSLSRILIALRHGTTMLNPGLYISAVPEQGFRMLLTETANLLSGESTGAAGALTSRFRLNQFDPETVQRLNRLIQNLANDNTFAGSIIKELVYQQPNVEGTGRVVRAFERFAQVGNKWQDPTWGMPQKSLAKRYVEAVLRATQALPISNVMSPTQVIAYLDRDPGYFAKHHPEIHQIASNSVVDQRGLKNTPYSLAIKAMYEPLTRSSSATLQFAGLLLKLPLMYANFTTNMLTTLTGMQGYTQVLATFLDARQTPGTLMHRMAKAARGETLSAEDDVRYDMSSTMDGYTIANAFIRGGVTQTGLFTLGMLTGGILSGEDEEARRRRRLAQAQQVPLLADPRRLEADFRNKDLLFLDWLPSQLQAAFRLTPGDANTDGQARAAVQMSWLMKPFLSPLIGMERFFQTGDFGWVTFGFIDGVGSLPVFNKAMYDDAIRSADELAAMAAEQQALGTPTSMKNSTFLLIQAVGVYERMLLENMFINSLYTGFDQWDRDATKLPLLDSDGTIQRTLEGEPRPNDLALESFLDAEGNVAEGYQNRDDWSTLMAYYTKNNFSAAAILSLFTGFNDNLFRSQMPIKMREVEIPQITSDEATRTVVEALQQVWRDAGQVPTRFTLQEITKALSSKYASEKNWDAYNQVDQIAAQVFSDARTNPRWDALSVLGIDGEETLTTNGVAAVLSGLQAGTIDLDHPAMQGIAIPFEMREQIQKEFLEDVTQEGVDLGLTNTQAVARAKRLFYGPLEDPSVVGFSDILWSDKIPYTNKLLYKQLNTTYVTGPDGFPWATGFKRGGLLSQLGLPKRPVLGLTGGTTTDGRMNTVDLVANINTGLRGLVPFNASENVPTDKEIGDSIVKAIEEIEARAGEFEPYDNKSSSGRFYGGYRRYSRGGYSRGGYSRGSYGGYSPTIYFSRMPYLDDTVNVYGDSTKNIFWDNVTIRRATIRRERVQSARGRLKQWQ